jgi:hypothetical protein
MRMGKNALRKKYGIDLPSGKYSIKTGDSYEVYKVRDDTEGCILVGSTHAKDFVGNSRATFAKLLERIEHSLDAGAEVELEIL